jgi:hypothetical protein
MASTFLGYAPVLDAISVLLEGTTNYLDLRSEIASEVGTGKFDQPVKLLRKIVESILNREWQNKLVKNIRPALATAATKLGWSDWDNLYTPSEQTARLIGKFTGQGGKLWTKPLPPQFTRLTKINWQSGCPSTRFCATETSRQMLSSTPTYARGQW